MDRCFGSPPWESSLGVLCTSLVFASGRRRGIALKCPCPCPKCLRPPQSLLGCKMLQTRLQFIPICIQSAFLIPSHWHSQNSPLIIIITTATATCHPSRHHQDHLLATCARSLKHTNIIIVTALINVAVLVMGIFLVAFTFFVLFLTLFQHYQFVVLCSLP